MIKTKKYTPIFTSDESSSLSTLASYGQSINSNLKYMMEGGYDLQTVRIYITNAVNSTEKLIKDLDKLKSFQKMIERAYNEKIYDVDQKITTTEQSDED